MMQQMNSGLGVVLKDLAKSIKALEIRRVTGANCHYSSVDLTLQYEKDLDISNVKGQVQSGTRSIVKVYQAMTFMIAFLRELTTALNEDKPFKGPDRARLYEVGTQ